MVRMPFAMIITSPTWPAVEAFKPAWLAGEPGKTLAITIACTCSNTAAEFGATTIPIPGRVA